MGSRRQFFVLSCALLVLVCVMGVVGHGGHHGHGPGVLENTVPKESLITVSLILQTHTFRLFFRLPRVNS